MIERAPVHVLTKPDNDNDSSRGYRVIEKDPAHFLMRTDDDSSSRGYSSRGGTYRDKEITTRGL